MEDSAQAEDLRDQTRNESNTNRLRQDFVYSPLNHQAPSIRLVRILEDLSPDGCIQCEVRHASTASTYVCLSYVWGEPEEGQWILLNDQRHWVRDNLGQFLQSARQKPHVRQEWLWIDALSINQDNNTERNHQVQQMGRIYTNATMVISWFGMDADIERWLNCIASYRLFSIQEGSSLYNSAYWKRAWITQEFALAQRSTFMAGNSDVDSERLPTFDTIETSSREGKLKEFGIIARIQRERSAMKGQCLFSILESVHDKQCSNPRDRIFSLLALCSDCRNLKVDYDIPPQDLLVEILESCQDRVCFCTANFLSHILAIERSTDNVHRQDVAQLPLVYTESPDISLSPFRGFKIRKSHTVTAFAQDSDMKEFWIPVDLGLLCWRTYGYLSFFITSNSTRVFDSAVDKMLYSWNPQKVVSSDRQPVHGCTIEVSRGGTTCVITLSFDMFLKIARASGYKGQYGCCSRATRQMGRYKEPTISLHHKQVRIEVHTDVNWQGQFSST